MKEDNKRGFFSFKKMITVPFMKVIYLTGFIGINLCALFLWLYPFLLDQIGMKKIEILEKYKFGWEIWVILFFVIHLFWRLFCECILVIFRIYETLISIDSEMKGKGITGEKIIKTINAKKPPKNLRTREDYKKWKERK